MRQTLGPGALGKPRGSGWRGRWGGGIGMGNTFKPMAVSFQCMTKFTTNKKKKKEVRARLLDEERAQGARLSTTRDFSDVPTPAKLPGECSCMDDCCHIMQV